MQIIDRIQEIISKKLYSVADISRTTGINQDRIYKWLSHKGNPKHEDSQILEQWLIDLDKNPNSTEKFVNRSHNHTQKETHILIRMALKHKSTPIPVTNIKASAGQIVTINDEPELILEYIEAPFLKGVEGVIEVAGHSMYPKFPNGTRLAIKKLEFKKLIRPGEDYYIIDVNYEGYVKRLYKIKDDDNSVELRSYNEDMDQYPNFKMSWDDIIAVFKVKAGIQLT